MTRVQVRKARTTSRVNRTTSKKNWQVRQPATNCAAVRVFVYSSHRWAILNADRLARGQRISTYGLRGFHIEYV
ncbi:hypothetical protein [Mycobacterium intracellulare]|uniref:Uncharacterized protein n=1 Tax=Mycobacterium intracellulare TaxID=1767 RepID=A0AAE4UAN7_MYCIT|nr:hypothetical protein [Mycobacterium intracellulare]MDV6975304.1 hypothetical protein [Mycobacterium intracellulare]MDV6980368.1 hypothetical protein [Mycobacterium intracellulare]MDV7010797.1 hypothetical protein [Mycobacterium intracellulare]MDV7025703.1 hypothetical protein [Mycobacterium intracellulare]